MLHKKRHGHTASDGAKISELPESTRKPERSPWALSSPGDIQSPSSTPKTPPRFWRHYAIYLCILLAVAVSLLTVLWIVLERFQNQADAEAAMAAAAVREVPEHPQLALERFIEDASADYWTDLYFKTYPDSYDSRDTVLQTMQRHFDKGGLTRFKTAEFSSAAPEYVLKNGETRLASVRFALSKGQWTAEEPRLFLRGEKTAAFEALSGASVFCNGKPVPTEAVVSSASYFEFPNYSAALQNPVTWLTYQVSGLLETPQMSAVPPDGRSVTADASGRSYYTAGGETADSMRDKAYTFTRALLFYYMCGQFDTENNLYATLAHVRYNSQAYDIVLKTLDGVIWNAYYDADYRDIRVGEVIAWADNCYTVDVAYRITNAYATGNPVLAEGGYRLCLVDDGSGYAICDMEKR